MMKDVEACDYSRDYLGKHRDIIGGIMWQLTKPVI